MQTSTIKMQFFQVILLASLVMFASAQCSGTWSPSAMPSYVLSWEVSSDTLSVRFNVTVPTTGWAAVGFSTTASMLNSDIAIAADDGMNSFVEDRYVSTSRVEPSIDTAQSFTDAVTNRMSGVLSFAFTRLINSTDTSGQDVNLNVCQHVLWAFGGTVTFGNPTVVGNHGINRRDVFSNQICLQQCERASECSALPGTSACNDVFRKIACADIIRQNNANIPRPCYEP